MKLEQVDPGKGPWGIPDNYALRNTFKTMEPV